MKTKQQIEKSITSIATRGKNIDNDIQMTACDVLMHIDRHGEVSLAIKLFNAMPASSRRAALVSFLTSNGKVMANPDPKLRKQFPFVYNKQGPSFCASTASNKPWYEHKKESQAAVFGETAMLKQIKTLQTKINKAIEAGTMDADNADVVAVLAIGSGR